MGVARGRLPCPSPPRFFHIGGMAFLDFHPLSPISTPFHTFLLISTMDTHTLVWHLELG